ncbi:MAG: hypothetical protein R3E79_46110 [Caldilineaceae bacterium]
MPRSYSLVDDPVFYITVAFFAFVTTGLPTAIGQPNFLPIVQTLALFIFMLIPLRQGMIRQTLWVLGLWLVIQFILVVALTWLLEARVERAFHGGFQYRMDYIAWFYGAEAALRPDSFGATPIARLMELAGVLIGSLVSGGLIGIWFLVKSVNLAAYSMGALTVALQGTASLLLALPFWTLLRIGGYAGLIALLSEPLLTGNWQPRFYWQSRRRLLLTAGLLLLVGLLSELFLPDLWRMFAGE